ncbi:uncharacterized protein PAE49_005636 isoform 2-T2 [Odontesthes bonariensis]|uniref:uncharacterized protein LOC142379685 isoform X2 n=1 Tax=Odontesthes bonariensis TaxID=219752 RepID=UPI003F58F117
MMSLSQVQTLRVAAVIEDCVHQLDILGHTLTAQINKEQHTAPGEQMAQLHFQLDERQSFSSLQQVVEREEQKSKDEENRKKAKTELEQSLKKQQQEIQEKKEKLNDMSTLRAQLKEVIALRKMTVKPKTVPKPVQKENCKPEKLLEDQLELLEIELKEEKRSHEVSERFLLNQHTELQQVLYQWQRRTKQMLQEKENQLNSVCCKRTVNLDKLMEMRRKFREMELVAMEDKEEQEKLRQKQEEARVATKLQAWWRGCMVRRGLGPYKKAEEDKEGKKKKKGKKKKLLFCSLK